MKLPESLMNSLADVKGFNRESFEEVHTSGQQITSIRLNPRKKFQLRASNIEIEQVPWCDSGYYLSRRPSFTFDPLFHAGCYYVQEASSMFLEQALKQMVDLSQSLKILDLAAAPGGKSTHIQSLISKDSLLVSNEVIRSRGNILKDNIIKWGSDNVLIVNNDPKDFARLENYFDVIVVDAPCSGSGLFRRDEEAIEEWSENNVKLCSQRQQRILADAWPALKKNGLLIYSTCSYSKEEDEEIVKWITRELSVVNCQLSIDRGWGIVESGTGYRFWPDKLKGEGFFIACLKKTDEEDEGVRRAKREFELLSRKERTVLNNWVKETDHAFVKIQNIVYAVPAELVGDVNILCGNLHQIYFGVMIGELVRDKLVPAHALAMSHLVSEDIEKVPLNDNQAIHYLQKKELKGVSAGKGWKLVTYKNYPLGWINILPNRINNYYPKELRILKDI